VPDFLDEPTREHARALALDLAAWRSGPDPWARQRRQTWDALLHTAQELAPPPGVFADLGSGDGGLARRAARLGYQAFAVDVLPFPRSPDIERIRSRFETLPFADGALRVAAMCASLHYAPDVAAALAEARRTLAAKGVLLVALTPVHRNAPAANGAAESTRRLVRQAGGSGPIALGYRHLVESDLRAAFDRAAFSVEALDRLYGLRFRLVRALLSRATGQEYARFPLFVARPAAAPAMAGPHLRRAARCP